MQLGQPPKSIIRPVPTRWTAFYLAYKRLLDLRKVLKIVVQTDDMKLPQDRIWVQGDKEAKIKARQMAAEVLDSTFWHGIVRYLHSCFSV